MTITFLSKDQKAIVKICGDGKIFWHGREVQTDTKFKSAMIDLANRLCRHGGKSHV